MSFIQKEKLPELYKECKNKILDLLKTSSTLHNTESYQYAILFSIISIEEIYKLDQISKHIQSGNGFSKEEWGLLVDGKSHKKKLTGFYVDSINAAKNMGKEKYESTIDEHNNFSDNKMDGKFESAMNNVDYISKRLEKLNKIKQSILYLGWNKEKSESFVFTSLYDKNTTGLFSVYLYDLVNFQLREIMLNHKYNVNWYLKIPKEINLMVQDELSIQQEEYHKKIETDNYKQTLMIGNSILEFFPKPLIQ